MPEENDDRQDVTFDNVRVTIRAKDADTAYKMLCEMFETLGGDLDYMTDTFSDATRTDEDTSALWPDRDVAVTIDA